MDAIFVLVDVDVVVDVDVDVDVASWFACRIHYLRVYEYV